VLIDIIGSWPSPVKGLINSLKDGVSQRPQLLRHQRRVFRSLDEAISRYMANNPFMERESAYTLLSRGTEEVVVDGVAVAEGADGTEAAPAAPYASSGDTSIPKPKKEASVKPPTAARTPGIAASAAVMNGLTTPAGSAAASTPAPATAAPARRELRTGVCFRHDPRLMGRNLLQLTQEQNIEACRAIECPTLLLIATNPLRRRAQLPGGSAEWMLRTFGDRAEAVKDCTRVVVESSHHLHLDTAEKIGPLVSDFLVDPALLPIRGLLQPLPTYTEEDGKALQARSRL
jgi:hypothetical protein